MASNALPVESLLPFHQSRAPESMSALRRASDGPGQDTLTESPIDDDEDSDVDKPAKRQKRSRACVACRGMKIRCLPVEGQEACLSCAKVNRECVMPGPARKRQKTVHKVAELEKKINALTDALIAKNQADPTPPNDSPANDRYVESQSDITRSEAPTSEYIPSGPDRLDKAIIDKVFAEKALPGMNKDWDMTCFKFKKAEDQKEDQYVDVIDRGIIDMENATKMFNHWKHNLCPIFPVVSLQDHVTAQDVRATRPMLFLAAITCSSSAVRPECCADLVLELNRQLAERVLFLGEKSLELIQAIVTYTAYYVRPKDAKDLAFNQYIHAAVVMCLDLGVGKRYKQGFLKDPIEEAEIRRTWLGCFNTASSVATLLRHPSLVSWSPYVEECLQFFETSKAAMPSDKWLCALVNLQRITEEVSLVFNLDDPSSNLSFTDTKTQYHLKAFERQLAAWRQTVPPGIDQRMVDHLACSTELYIHEIAIHNDHIDEGFRPPFHDPIPINDSGSFVTTAHIDALSTCLDSCHRILSAYLAMDVNLCRSLNNLYLVWNTYAAVTLIKLHGILNANDSKFGSIFTPDLKVNFYLDAIASKLAQVSRDNRWPAAEAFGFVTKKLKSWYTHRRAPNADADSLSADDKPPSLNRAGQEQVQANALRDLSSMGLPESYSGAFTGSQQSDLNAAFNAANYNLNWDDLNFSVSELNAFDVYMNDPGWMNYVI